MNADEKKRSERRRRKSDLFLNLKAFLLSVMASENERLLTIYTRDFLIAQLASSS
jgi:hypothetical protein